MTDFSDKTCNETLISGFRFGKCGRPAKHLCKIVVTNGESRRIVNGFRCGIHARRYEKVASFKDK